MREISEFAGMWLVRRFIEDRFGRQTGEFRGVAILRPKEDGQWSWGEDGKLKMGDEMPVTATRFYLWRQGPEGIEVSFEDGRPFHSFTPDGSVQAAHWCDPDDYRVSYDFSHWPAWTAEWRVTGPRKDYVMISHYTRR